MTIAHRSVLVLAFIVGGSAVVSAQTIRVSSDRTPEVPEEYLVEEGDTLWDVCEYYFAEPRRWPTVWALNPHITNPHWIYPGDILRLRLAGEMTGPDGVVVQPFNYTIGVSSARQVSLSEGFVVEKPIVPVGHIGNSPHSQTYLAGDDLVYLDLVDLGAARVGQRFSVYRVEHEVVHPERGTVLGQKIRIMGVIEIETVEKHVARARIVSAFSELVRGMPLTDPLEHYVVVSPRQNLIDLNGTIVDGLKPAREIGQFDTIFIDRGSKDGVQVGNRFFVMRRGDGRLELTKKAASKLPWEQVGEALVVLTRDRTSTALVTRSAIELRRGDRVVMQRHY
jgi:hypothetical protein